MRILLPFILGQLAVPCHAQQVQRLDFTAEAVPALPGLPTAAAAEVTVGAVRGAVEMEMQAFMLREHQVDGVVADACAARDMPDVHGLTSDTRAARRRLWSLVADAECRHGLPAGLLDALVIQESRYKVGARSEKQAGGLTQLMPGTARDLGVFDRFDPHLNVDGGARYLRQQLETFKSVPLALAAYNAGPHRVKQYRGVPPFRETRNYIDRVLWYWGTPDGRSNYIARTAVRLGFNQ